MAAAPRISLITALDRAFAIGRAGAMPWHLPDDLRRFKALTLGKPVLMGRRTALAIGRALPGRPNLVLTRGGARQVQLAGDIGAGQATCRRIEKRVCIAGHGHLEVCVGRVRSDVMRT